MESRSTLLNIVIILLPLMITATDITINSKTALYKVEPHYVSFCMDDVLLSVKPRWLNFNFMSPKLHALMLEMSPAILRFGGSGADWTIFQTLKAGIVLNKTGVTPPLSIFTKQDLFNMVTLTWKTGNRFLYDLNLQLRYGKLWDPTNTYELMHILNQQVYGDNIDFELGNEPSYYSKPGEITMSPEQIANDYLSLDKLLRSFPNLQRSSIVGPDVVGVTNKLGHEVLQSVTDKAGGVMKAITFHHYYFRGDTAHVKDYINPTHFNALETTINQVKAVVANTSHPDIPIWIGETADSWHGGTQNVTDRFVSGFLWLDKLGLAASLGISTVMRQTFYYSNYALLDRNLNPNPDYWLSWIFKKLAGTVVLEVSYSKKWNTTRVYAHCTNIERTNYPKGAVTFFALNMNETTDDVLTFDTPWNTQFADMYLLTPPLGDPKNILSKNVAVNGQVMEITNDTTFPTLSPVTEIVAGGLSLPPHSMAFFVFPKANLDICSSF